MPREPVPQDHVGYLIERGRSLILVCWRCKRRGELTPEQVAAAATKGPDEEVWWLVRRCRCGGCGAKGPKFRYEGEPRPTLHGGTISDCGNLRWEDEN